MSVLYNDFNFSVCVTFFIINVGGKSEKPRNRTKPSGVCVSVKS